MHLPGFSDSDSDGDRRYEHEGHHDPRNDGPGDELEEDERLPDVAAPLPPLPVQIHANTYRYIQIHTHTYTYIHIHACINILISR